MDRVLNFAENDLFIKLHVAKIWSPHKNTCIIYTFARHSAKYFLAKAPFQQKPISIIHDHK